MGGYAAFQTNLNITVKGNIVDRSRVIQSWGETSNEDFHTDYYRENIVSATFLDDARVPSNAVESWDVSETKDRGVMAYVVPNDEDNTKYDLYIGAKDGVIANEDSSWLFYEFVGLASINFNNSFDTSHATNMLGMFTNCCELLTIDVSEFNTSNVTNMTYMFASSISARPMKLQTIIFGENFDTSNVTNMWAMFGNCNDLINLDVSGFNTSNVTNMYDMFSSCHSLISLDLSNWDTSKVTNMNGMFFGCKNIVSLDLCSFNTNNVTDMTGMFASTQKLTELKVGPTWTTDNAITTRMFTNSAVSSVTTGQC